MVPNVVPKYGDLPGADGGARSAWGVFGPQDSVGRLNLQTADSIQSASHLVRKGSVFPLDAPLGTFDPPLFGRGAPKHKVFEHSGGTLDDALDNVFPQASSQWDSLAHVAYDPEGGATFYGGCSLGDIRAGGRNGVDHWARRGIVGRAVVLDLELTMQSRLSSYSPGESIAIDVADLEAARSNAGVAYQRGDVLLICTGFVSWYGEQPRDAREGMAHRGQLRAAGLAHSERIAEYLWDAEIAAIGTDSPALEVWPPDEGRSSWPFGFLHRVLIAQLGFAIGELWALEELCRDCRRDGIWEAFFTSAPWHLAGGIGSPANAIAVK
jgi:kynurenine formamidase